MQNLKKISIFLLLALIIIIPFFFQKKETTLNITSEEKLIVITPHNEAIRFEFDQGFVAWYKKKTGKTVTIDWRTLGGTQEVLRYINACYVSAFELFYKNELEGPWSKKVEAVFANPNVHPSSHSKQDTPDQAVRRAFLESNVSSGMDVLFGGGEIEIRKQAAKGQLVPSGIVQKKLPWFQEQSLPHSVVGIEFWDHEQRWIGAVRSSFGIIFNRNVLLDLGIYAEPQRWSDLESPLYWSEIALSDPIMSASTNRIFDMIIQEQMNESLKALDATHPNTDNLHNALTQGWEKGMESIQLICANARYFTDSSSKPILDVSSGDCAAGICIDFYGLFQEENLRVRSDSCRFGFVMPQGGSAIVPDGMGILKGAPNPQLALVFMEYVLSLEGQKLWCFKVGTPGGPKRYALNRAPVRKELYREEYSQYCSNPNINSAENEKNFVYRSAWTHHLFNVLRFVIKAAFIDAHKELASARKAIIDAEAEGRHQAAQNALAHLQNLPSLNYHQATHDIKNVLSSDDPLRIIQFQGKMTQQFRDQYRRALSLAKAH